MEGYTFIGHNRNYLHKNSGYGGVAFLIKDDLLNAFVVDITDNEIKGILWIYLKCNNDMYKNIVACVCYLLPLNSSRQIDGNRFYDNSLCQFGKCHDENAQMYVCGDFKSRCSNSLDYIQGIDNLPDRDAMNFSEN